MFLYNIHYDKELNTLSGDKIIIPEGVSANSRIALTADIDKSCNVHIEFSVPKSRKIRSERMELLDGKYYLTIPDIVTESAGNADVQLVFIRDNIIEKSLTNSQLLTISSSINAVKSLISSDKTIVDSLMFDNIQHGTKLTEHEKELLKHNSQIEECKKLAQIDKFKIEIIYDKASPSADINHGFPNGLKWREKITGLNLSSYRYLMINCRFDRNLTMIMDLSDKNHMNKLFINSMMGSSEIYLKYAFIGFEIIVDADKTYIEINNTIKSASYTGSSDLIPDKNAYVSKIYGIV